jgi:hypothetical protein
METLYELITNKIDVTSPSGIRNYGHLYELDTVRLDPLEFQENLEGAKIHFLGLLDNTLSNMIYTHYLLSPVMGGVQGDNVIQLEMDKNAKYLPELSDMSQVGKEVLSVTVEGPPIMVDLDKIKMLVLSPPSMQVVDSPSDPFLRRLAITCRFGLMYL